MSILVASAETAFAADAFPPSPYDILRSRDLDTPLLDAVAYCVPPGLDPAVTPVLEQASAGEWREARQTLADWARGLDAPGIELVTLDAVLMSREVEEREDRLEVEEHLRAILRRRDIEPVELCLRLELARTLLEMGRDSEAAAQLARAERRVEDERGESRHAEEVAFWRAEILYRRGRAFDAHLAYRKLTRSKNARLALASRLRLTDLSFDSGKVEKVSDEYEALLPRASAYGASLSGWARRAAEAALDAGEHGRAIRWLERFLESGPDRDARDAVEVRLADLDAAFDDPLLARKRLSGVSSRQRSDPLGALAAVRAIDLGVAPGSPDQRLDMLLRTLRDQRDGVRRYALGVLMEELQHRGDLDGSLAVATRLAYEGLDPVVTPHYTEGLDDVLGELSERRSGGGDCGELVRAIGGRYGILIERASDPEAFAQVGECFEEMELPWLAATLYRTIARRFGTAGAERIALPLARASLSVGEVTLARRVASAALEEPDESAHEWRAILAEADFIDGRFAESATGLKEILDRPELERDRGRLVRLLALTLEASGSRSDARFVGGRVAGWLEEGGAEPGAEASMIEAAILTAHAHRKAGRASEAHRLYRVVDAHAKPGALRSSARFWLGLDGEADAQGEPAWGEDPNIALGTPWARYATFESRVGPLWKAYARSLR
ncbi:unnamed protein product [Discosporangium mesarthrocarpum]